MEGPIRDNSITCMDESYCGSDGKANVVFIAAVRHFGTKSCDQDAFIGGQNKAFVNSLKCAADYRAWDRKREK